MASKEGHVAATKAVGGEKEGKMMMKKEKAELLDEEGDLSDAFLKVLQDVFKRFSQQARGDAQGKGEEDQKGGKEDDTGSKGQVGEGEQHLDRSFIMTDEEMDNFARVVNDGEVMSKESKDEIKEFLDVDEKGQLTYTGFCEMYHLQSGSDAQETWKDLKALGYDEQLQLR